MDDEIQIFIYCTGYFLDTRLKSVTHKVFIWNSENPLMQISLTDPLIIQITVSFLIMIVLLYQRFKFNITPLNLPVLMTFFSLIRAIADYTMNQERNFFVAWENIHFIFYGLAIYTIYIFGERLTYSKYQALRKSSVLLSFGLFLGFFFNGMLIQDYIYSLSSNCTTDVNGCNPPGWKLYAEIPYWEFFFDVYQLLVFSYLLIIFISVLRAASNRLLRRPLFLLLMGVISFVLLALLEVSEHLFHYEINAWYTALVGYGFILYVFIKEPRSLYSSASEIYRLTVVLSDSGVPIFVKPFIDRPMFDISLVASISLTINQTFKEITSSKGNVTGIEIENSGIILAHSDKIFTILEVEHPASILKDAIKDFTVSFEKQYSDLIDEFQGQLLKSEEIDEFLTRYFPTVKG